jgi:hypothetical protein
MIRNTRASYIYDIILLNFVHSVTNIQTLKHFVSDASSASFFRQKALKLFHPLDEAILIHSVQNDRRFLPEDGSRDRFRSAVIRCLYICKKWVTSKRRSLYLYVMYRRQNLVVLKSHLISKFPLY